MKRTLLIPLIFFAARCADANYPPVPNDPPGDSLTAMSRAPFSTVKINAREQALSTDVDRMQQLLSRDIQNLAADESSSATGTPYSVLTRPITLAAATAFGMNLSAGQAFTFDSTITGDDSPFAVTRWDVQALTFANPDGSNPRIDLVVATPGTQDTDLVSRNVLVNPVGRTITAQNIFKTTNPVAAVTIVVGTPGATPAPPALPAGAIPLFEVWVPAAAADSTAFRVTPRAWRKMSYPWSTSNGIMSGMRLRWDLSVDPTTTSSTLSLLAGNNRILIDGEVVEFTGTAPVVQDSQAGQNPLTVAPVAYARPYYIYAVGGRHAPQRSLTGGALCPVSIVESTIAPDLGQGGIPSATIGVPGGVVLQTGAVYIGIGWIVPSSSRRAPCVMTDDMTMLAGGDFVGRISHTKVAVATLNELLGSLPSRPLISSRALVAATVTAGAGTTVAVAIPDRGDGGGFAPAAFTTGLQNHLVLKVRTFSAGVIESVEGMVYFNPANAQLWGGFGASAGDLIEIAPQGYDHRVPRLAF